MVILLVLKLGVYVFPTTVAVEEVVFVGELVVVDVIVEVLKLTDPLTVLLRTTEFRVNSKVDGDGTKSKTPLVSLNCREETGFIQVTSLNVISSNWSA